MDKFWELLRESVIMQGLLTLLVVGTWCYLVIVGRTVPQDLSNVLGLVIGFFFGGKLSMLAAKSKE